MDRVLLLLLDRLAPARSTSGVLLEFPNVIITAIVCPAPVIDLKPPNMRRTT